MARLTGTVFADVLGGTRGRDFINALAGDDRIRAAAGNDEVKGGSGDDRIKGGRDKDKLYGNSGDDKLYGQAGDDLLIGGSGDDLLVGGSGDDTLKGGGGKDTLKGGSGEDDLRGGGDRDLLRAGGDNDILSGGGGNDRLYGNSGDDHLSGGSGNDRLGGGRGDDELVGGGGRDVAVFLGDFADYDFSDDAGTLVVSQARGSLIDGTDRVAADIEVLQFADLIVDLTGNALPSASGDALTANEIGVTTSSTSVLANDSDIEATLGSQTLAVTEVNGTPIGAPIPLASGATVTMQANGLFDYDPGLAFVSLALGATATDTFTYTVADGAGGTATGTVTVTVEGTNTAPVVAAAFNGAATEDGTAQTFDFQGSDVDSDDDQATLTYTITNAAGVTEGLLVKRDDGTTFRFDPLSDFQDLAEGQTRDVSFEYTATDRHGEVSNTGTATITVTGENDTPTLLETVGGSFADTANKEAGYPLPLSGSIAASGGDEDNGAVLTFTISGRTPEAGTTQLTGAFGRLTLQTNGSYLYLASGESIDGLIAGQQATDVFNVTVTDEHGASATSTFTVEITGANDTPTFFASIGGDLVDLAGPSFQPPVTGSVASYASDRDTGATITFAIDGGAPSGGATVLAGAYGTLTLESDGSYSYSPNHAAVDALPASAFDSDVFNLIATDDQDATATAILTFNVHGENDTPTFQATLAGTVADTAAADNLVPVTGTVAPQAADRDDGATITFTISGGTPSGGATVLAGAFGTLTLQSDGSYSYAPNNAAIDALAVGATNSDVFNLIATDDQGATATANLTFNVTGANDTPTLAAGGITTVDTSAADGFGYVSSSSFGADRDSAATLTYNIDGEVPDPAGETTLAGTFGTLLMRANGSWIYMRDTSAIEALNVGDTATDVFNVTVTDEHGASATNTLTFSMTGANDTPVISAISTVELAEADTATPVSVDVTTLFTATDADDGETPVTQNVQVTPQSPLAVANPSLLSVNGTNVEFDRADFAFLADGESAIYNVTFNVVSGVDTVPQSTSITITGANDAPTASATKIATNLGTAISGQLAGVDPDAADTLTFSIDTAPQNGTLDLASDGSYTYTPGVEFTGTDNFVFQVDDGNGGTATATATIEVAGGTAARLPNVLALSPDGAELVEDNASAYKGSSPHVTPLGDGHLVVWTETGNDGNGLLTSSVYGRVYNASGNATSLSFRVNSTADQYEYRPSAVEVPGGFLVVWDVRGQDNPLQSDHGIYGQLFDTAGNKLGGEVLINDTVVGNQTRPQLATLGTGSVAVMWQDNSSGLDVVVRVIDPDTSTGTIDLGTPEVPIHTASGNQYLSRQQHLTTLADGRVLAVWDDSSFKDGSGYGVFGRIIGLDGSLSPAEEFQINTSFISTQYLASAAALGSGFVVTWFDTYPDSAIRAQRFDANGEKLGLELVVDAGVPGLGERPVVQDLLDGGFVVLWRANSLDADGSYSILGQRFDANGDRIGDIFRIDDVAESSSILDVTTAVRDDGALILAWPNSSIGVEQKVITDFSALTTYRPDPDSDEVVEGPPGFHREAVAAAVGDGHVVVWANNSDDIHARLYDGSGNPVGEDFRLNETTFLTQYQPVVVAVDGGFLAAWASWDQDGNHYGVVARLFDDTGAAVSDEFIVNETTAGPQWEVSATVLQDGNVVLTWRDESTSDDQVNLRILGVDTAEADPTQALTAVTGELPASSQTASSIQHSDQAVAGLSSGGFVAVWTTSTNYDVYARVFAADGTTAATEFTVNQYTLSNQQVPVVAALPTGFAVAWYGRLDASAALGVGVRLFDDAGQPLTGDVTVGVQSARNLAMQSLPDGSFAVVWEASDLDAPGRYDIVGQRFDANGAKVGDLFKVSSPGDGFDRDPSLTLRDDGALIAVWHDDFGNQYEIEQRVITDIDALPAARGTAEQLVSDGTANAQFAEIANLGDGHIVVWQASSASNPDADAEGVYARIYDQAGEPVGDTILLNAGFTSGWQQLPSVTEVAGGFVATWQADDGSNSGIFGRLFTADGTATSDPILLHQADFTDRQANSSVTTLANGHIALTYEARNSGANDIETVVLSVNVGGGTFTPAGNIEIANTNAGAQFNEGGYTESIAALGTGGYVTVWRDNEDSGDIYGRLHNANGTPVGASDFQINSADAGNQGKASVASLGDGFIVTWRDSTDGGIRARIYDDQGQSVVDEFKVNSTTYNNDTPKAFETADGGFVIVWVAYNNTGDVRYDIVGQRFDANAERIGSEFVISERGDSNSDYDPSVTVRTDGSIAVAWYENANGDYAIKQKIVDFGEDGVPIAAKNLTGGDGNDAFIGSSFADVMDGGAGDDQLTGLGGGDDLTGGFGDDSFIFVKGSGAGNIIRDFGDTAGDNDTIDLSDHNLGTAGFSNLAALIDADIVKQDGADVTIDLPDGTNIVIEDTSIGDLKDDDFAF